MKLDLNDDELMLMTQMVMDTLDHWQVPSEHRINILGLEGKAKSRQLARYRIDLAFPRDTDVLDRAKRLLLINDALHTTFPHNVNMANYWMTTPNRHLQNQTPLDVMVNEGHMGIRKVHATLDCTEMWV